MEKERKEKVCGLFGMYCKLRKDVLHGKRSGEKECVDELYVRDKKNRAPCSGCQ